ncbi:putative RNase H-like HicB family nuclease [Dysgonomonas sp. PH5-45]|uniref:type II toxin-antitoxin system HicB family antitoxin n=1 Tax=unclassified Dysgonomonas TaxID=2630389 RepID=UPI002473AAF9|nr:MULTISPECIES: type II toxin-antitoxin system HicB family antitoxin [unclassified Dysgonomonas]MDH6355466.1 putative RNase H-like HicB family nuclease [Dysgonomonas sp. PH5-45]MDH6388362.1 putative RNase H-like HicB family nuclease [Dysgonomonas sp. PH5-37]
MKKNIVTVGITENNYSASFNIGDGITVATGKTFDELKKEMKSAVEFHLECMREDGEHIPESLSGDYQLVYKFDPQSLLTHYNGIFTKAALEKLTGINQRQLQRYASGESKPRREQSEKIAKALHSLGEELCIVDL